MRHILESPNGSDHERDTELRRRNLSVRVAVKEIPSVFGSFFDLGEGSAEKLNANPPFAKKR